MLDPIKDIIRLIGLPDPALHALIGVAIFVLAATILRVSWHSLYPWLIVLAAQLLNEVADVAKDVMDGETVRWRGSLLDTVVTMALPTMMVFCSWTLHRIKGARRRTPSSDP